MKKMNVAWTLGLLFAVCLFLGCASPREHSMKDHPTVAGTWYMDGNASKPCHIWSSPEGLRVQNEFGLMSRLVYDPSGFVIALDWLDGLRGDLRDQTIVWRNGTSWSRIPSK
jgi:hypothetical protein